MKKKSYILSPTSFLKKTFDILGNDSLKTIISWSQEGTEFIIYSSNEFSEKVLPIYFKHSNYASFIRQLNMYDFHKLRSNTQENIYQHPLFLRGRPDLLKEIHRKTAENNWTVTQKNSNTRTNLNPFLKKLYQIHNKNVNYQEKIGALEEKVNCLMAQNKVLADQLWENKALEKKIEKALMFFARFWKNDSKNGEIFRNFSVFDSVLSITEVSDEQVSKKRKVDQEINQPESPLSLSIFEDEEVDEIIQTSNKNGYCDVDRFSEISFDDKIDLLLNY